jgi:hypothetical protein
MTLRFHCKKCDGRAFRDISALRRHQWAEHRESFDNLKRAARNSSKAAAPKKKGGDPYWSKLSAEQRHVEMVRRRQVRRAKALVKLEPSPNGQRPPMLASDLLTQLQSQHRFLADVLGLISGMITQHEDNK